MTYRSDIDGLRSIAVLIVILHHAGFTFFGGGFVGVDVFFVLSGFLITSIIAPRIESRKFSFRWFFVRRIKRLLPVSFLVIGITGLIFTWVMLPSDLVRFYQSVIYIVFYVGNFFFWREHGGYFGGDAQEAPLLHTWSLAVEEQYYFVWPVILLLTFSLSSKRLRLIVFVGLFFITTFLSELGTQITLGAAYYLLPTRFFELMAGSLLALYWTRLPLPSYICRSVLSFFGLLLILSSAILLDEFDTFPGYNALYPVIGTVLIIFARSGIVNKLLSLRPFVFTGKISYSMYLWHWPIFTFFRYTAEEMTLALQFGCIAVTYLLSIVSWRYVEQPFRESKDMSFKSVSSKYFLFPAIIFTLIALIGISSKGFPARFSESVLGMENALNSHSNISRAECHSALRASQAKPLSSCVVGVKKNQGADVFVIGDSHANHFMPLIYALTEDAGLSVHDYTLDQCIPIFDVYWGQNSYKAEQCKKRNDLARAFIIENEFKYVVLAASWPGRATAKLFSGSERITAYDDKAMLLTEKLRGMLKQLTVLNIIPVIFEDTPDLRGKSPKCPIKKVIFKESLDCGVISPRNEFIAGILKQLKQEFTNLVVIKPRDLICNGPNCRMSMKGVPLYRDDDHLNEEGARLLGSSWLELNQNPFRDMTNN